MTIKQFIEDNSLAIDQPPSPPETGNINHFEKTKGRVDWREVIAILPLPMLGLAASYGVYFFAVQFVPIPVAIIEAAGFECTYIGLSVLRGLDDKQRQAARYVSIGAVCVSVIYNSIAGAIHLQPDLLADLPNVWFIALVIVHGAPLAILTYFVADLIFHRDQ